MYRRRGSQDCTEDTSGNPSHANASVSKGLSQSHSNGNFKNNKQNNNNNNSKGTFRKSSSAEPSSVSSAMSTSSSKSHHLRKKSFTSFWSSLFGTKIPENRHSGISTQSSSFESVNTILSTNSFSFVSPKRYKGKSKGKRIPVAMDEGPMKPRRKISTLTRIGMKMGLKSKYNLQSCESLHHLSYMDALSACGSNTGTLSNTLMRKKRMAPAPPPVSPLALQQQTQPSSEQPSTSSAAVLEPQQPCCSKSCVSPAKTAKIPVPPDPVEKERKVDVNNENVPPRIYKIEPFKITAHKRSSSEGHSNSHSQNQVKPSAQYSTSTLTNTYRSKFHVRGKRKAPVPPNPFGDPDAPEETEEDNDRDRDRLTSPTSYTSAAKDKSNAPISTSVSVPKSTAAVTPVLNPGSGSSTSNTSRDVDPPLVGISNSKSKSSCLNGTSASAAQSTSTPSVTKNHTNHVNAEVTVIRSPNLNATAHDESQPTTPVPTTAAQAMAAPIITLSPEQDEDEIAQNILNDKQEQRSAQQQQQQQQRQASQEMDNDNRPGPSRPLIHRSEQPPSSPLPQPTDEDRRSVQKELDVLIAVSSQPRTLNGIDEQTQLQLAQLKREADKSPLMFLRPKSKQGASSSGSGPTGPSTSTSKNQSQFNFNFNFQGGNSSNGNNSSGSHNSQGSANGGGRLSSTFITPPASPNSPFLEEPLSPSSSTSSNSNSNSQQYPSTPSPTSTATSTSSGGKITPRPWYKRSSSSSSSSKKTKQLIKPLATMTKFSDIDREASRIVEENRRRSAEKAYNETARELITMFNDFNKTQITGTGNPDENPSTDDADNAANETNEHTAAFPGSASGSGPVQLKQPQRDNKAPSTSVNSTNTSSGLPQAVGAGVATSSTTAIVAGTTVGNSSNRTDKLTTISDSNSKVTVTHVSNGTPDKKIVPASSANGNAASSSTTEETSKKLAIVQPQANFRASGPETGATTGLKPNPGITVKSDTPATTSVPASTTVSSSTATATVATPAALSTSASSTFLSRKEDWTCSRCTLKNVHWRSSCEACYFKADSSVQKLSSAFETNSIQTSTSTPIPSTFIPVNGKLNPNPVSAQKSQLLPTHTNGSLTNKVLPTPKVGGSPNSAFTKITAPTSSDNKAQQDNNSSKKNQNLPVPAIPPCENFLSQLPVKETLAREEKLVGMKLDEDPSEELDIIRLRQARLAFFNKTTGATGAAVNNTDDNANTNIEEFPPSSSTSASDEVNRTRIRTSDSTTTVDFNLQPSESQSSASSQSVINIPSKSNNLALDHGKHGYKNNSDKSRKQPTERKELNVFSDDEDDSIDALLQIPNFKPSNTNNGNNVNSSALNNASTTTIVIQSKDNNSSNSNGHTNTNITCSSDSTNNAPNFTGPGPRNWNPLHSHRFRPMLESILESTNDMYLRLDHPQSISIPIYENWDLSQQGPLSNTNQNQSVMPYSDNNNFLVTTSDEYSLSAQQQYGHPFQQYSQYRPDEPFDPNLSHPMNMNNGRKTWTNTFMQSNEIPHNSPTDNNNYCYYANSHSDSSSCSEYDTGNLSLSQGPSSSSPLPPSSATTEPIDMDGKNRAPSRRHGSSHHHHSHYYYNNHPDRPGLGLGGDAPGRKLTLDDYRKLGAIPKNFDAYYGNGHGHAGVGEEYINLGGGSSGGSSSGSGCGSGRDRDRDDSSRRGSYNQTGRDRDEFKTLEDSDRSNVSDYPNFGDSTNTLAVNKLLRKLEGAIAKGDHRLAATLAHDLALLKVNCVVAKGGQIPQPITIRVYVEDRFMQQGPFQVQVTSQMTVKELKNKIETDWSIPSTFQKWILGRKIAEDDTQMLSDFDVVHDSMAFLYLVTPQIERAKEMIRSEGVVPTNTANTAKVNDSLIPNPAPAKVKQKHPSSPSTSRSNAQKATAIEPSGAGSKSASQMNVDKTVVMNSGSDKMESKPSSSGSSSSAVQQSKSKKEVLVSQSQMQIQNAQHQNKLMNASPNTNNIADSKIVNTSSVPPTKVLSNPSPVIPQNVKSLKSKDEPKKEKLTNTGIVLPADPTTSVPAASLPPKNVLIGSQVAGSQPTDPRNRQINKGPINPTQAQSSEKIINKVSPKIPEMLVAATASPVPVVTTEKSLQGTSKQSPSQPVSAPMSVPTTVAELNASKAKTSTATSTTDSLKKSSAQAQHVKVLAKALPIVTASPSSTSSDVVAIIPQTIEQPNHSTKTVEPNKSETPHRANNISELPKTSKVMENDVLLPAGAVTPKAKQQTQPLPAVNKVQQKTNEGTTNKLNNVNSNTNPKDILPDSSNKTSASSVAQPIMSVVPGKIERSSVKSTGIVNGAEISESSNGSKSVKSLTPANISSKTITTESPTKSEPNWNPEPVPQRRTKNIKKNIEESPLPTLSPGTSNSDSASGAVKLPPAAQIKDSSVKIINTVANSKTDAPNQLNVQVNPVPPPKSTKNPSPPSEISEPVYQNNYPLQKSNSATAKAKLVDPTPDDPPPPIPEKKPLNKKETSGPSPTTPDISSSKLNPVEKPSNLSNGSQPLLQQSNLQLPVAVEKNAVGKQESEMNVKPSEIVKELPASPNPTPENNIKVATEATNEKVTATAAVPEQAAGISSVSEKEDNVQTYLRMLALMEQSDLISNAEEFECPICFSKVKANEGVVLRDCLHSFCRECLIGSVQYADEPEVKCPFRDDKYSCNSVVQEREIKALVPPELFEKHLARSVKIAECKIVNTFHCKTADCTGWCVFEDDVNVFNCPVCKKRNCLTCQAIHEGVDCQQYQRQLAIDSETDENAKSSRVMLEKMIQRGEALECPACHVVLLKKWGCDWVRCSYCKTEICWVTKGFRWGPNGKGDTSGGCKCGVNGVRCHPKCTYCH